MRTAGAGAQLVLGLMQGLGNSFWNVIIAACEDALLRGGYGVVYGDTHGDAGREAHYEQLVRSGQVSGLLLFGISRPFSARLLSTWLPAVIAYGDTVGDGVPTFGLANREAAATMVRHLVETGHRRIAHLRGPEGNLDAEERLHGYRDGLEAAGIAYDPGLVWPGGFSFATGMRAAQRFRGMAQRPTAIFAASDEMAIGLMSGLRDAGIAVPEAVSVAGFDGTELSAMYQPGLTTMFQPRAELGRLAAESLVRQLAGGPVPAAAIRLPCRLVIRHSVAPPSDL